MEYFLVSVKYLDQHLYLIWYMDDIDGVIMAGSNILCFNQKSDLVEYCSENGIILEFADEFTTADFDAAINGLQQGIVDSKMILECWNLIDDIMLSLNDEEIENNKIEEERLYKKVFWSSNVPAVTPEGSMFTPSWSPEELDILIEFIIKRCNKFIGRLSIFKPNTA